MPGRDARSGLQLEHVGGQIGDRLLGRLLLPHPRRPPMWARVGCAASLPPTYFCTSSIFDAGT